MAKSEGNMKKDEMPLPKSRHHKIAVRLAVMGLTAKDISELWGCTPQQFLYWQRSDHRNVQHETLERLAEILGVSLAFLEDPDWEGLFAPLPTWLMKAQEKAAKVAAQEKGKKIVDSLGKTTH